jgi:Flp pilus assembly pilin Flp
MSMMMTSYLRNERGAEMVEWVVVVAILSVVASGIFGRAVCWTRASRVV